MLSVSGSNSTGNSLDEDLNLPKSIQPCLKNLETYLNETKDEVQRYSLQH